MVIDDLNDAIDNWIEELEQTNFVQIFAKPSPTNWSLGQVCMHLTAATNHYLEEASICLSTNENVKEEMSHNAKRMFHNNEFPDELIEGPPTNANTPQPNSKEELITGLLKLKEEIKSVRALMSTNLSKGKTKHPGLNYFNAIEWFQFAEMHFRHHERQKKRINEYLNRNK
jgi:hypothetical protein